MVNKIKQGLSPNIDFEPIMNDLNTNLNNWRERIPSKFENLTTWKTIIDQRNFLYGILKNKLNSSLNNTIFEGEADLNTKLSIFHDIVWNNLKYMKVERVFNIYGSIQNYSKEQNLYFGDSYLKAREIVFFFININFII